MTSVHTKSREAANQRVQIIAAAIGRLVLKQGALGRGRFTFSAQEVSSAITSEEWSRAWTAEQVFESATWIQRVGRRELSVHPLRARVDGVEMNLFYRHGQFVLEEVS